jgi:hypothetical protein
MLVVVARVGATGLGEYHRAQGFEDIGQPHEAAVHYGRAIHMYLPLSPLPSKAATRLIALAEASQRAGEVDEARFCYEELRSGFLAVRSFYQPGDAFIKRAEEALTGIMLSDPRASWPDRALPDSRREAIVREVLQEREDPSLPWVVVMGFGYLLWLGAAAAAIWRGLPTDGDSPIVWAQVRRFGALSLVGYLVWILGVALA